MEATSRLFSRKSKNNWCRRVILTEDTTTPARSQLDLSTNLVRKSLETNQTTWPDVWATESKEIKGLLLARTIVPNRASDLPVRVLNTANSPVSINKGTTTSELQPMSLLTAGSDGSEGNPDNHEIVEVYYRELMCQCQKTYAHNFVVYF